MGPGLGLGYLSGTHWPPGKGGGIWTFEEEREPILAVVVPVQALEIDGYFPGTLAIFVLKGGKT